MNDLDKIAEEAANEIGNYKNECSNTPERIERRIAIIKSACEKATEELSQIIADQNEIITSRAAHASEQEWPDVIVSGGKSPSETFKP